MGIAKALYVGTTANIAGTTTLAGVTATSITDSGLTSGRVTYAGTAGLLQDSANLTFNGTTLTANTIGAFTLSGTVAGGGNQLNNVIIGTTTPLAGAFTTVTLTSDTPAQFLQYGLVSASYQQYNTFYAFRGTRASPTQVLSGDVMALNGVYAYDNTATLRLQGFTGWKTTAAITGVNQSAWSVMNNAGTDIISVSSTGLAVTGTLSATGVLSTTNTVSGELAFVKTTNASGGYLSFYGNTSTLSGFLGSELAVRATGSVSNFAIRSAGDINICAGGGGIVGNFSSAGLAVTGALSATGTLSGGTSGTGYSFSGSAAAGSLTLDASGRLLVGQATVSNSINGLYFDPAGGGSANIVHASGTTSGTGYAFFLYAGGSIGSITQNGTTGVLYNLTSDYRLKNNPQPLTGAKDFIMALKPKKWQWWDGSGEGVGFVAHEFMEVAKYSGHGEKDAVEMQTYEISPAVPATQDEEGNELTAAVDAVMGEREVPKYQSIQPSSSEVMANLVAHIQELESRLAALEAK